MRRFAPPLAALAALVVLVVLGAEEADPGGARAAATTREAATAPAAQATPAAPTTPAVQAALAVLTLIPDRFAAADPVHDAVTAGRVRKLAAIVAAAARADPGLQAVAPATARLVRTLAATRVRLQPWPLPQTVNARSATAARALRRAGAPGLSAERPYHAIDRLLSGAATASSAGDGTAARLDAAGAYAIFALGPGRRLALANGELHAHVDGTLWSAVAAATRPRALQRARSTAHADVQTAATALGDTTVSRATVVADAGVIVFREGLEAVLILAAITASFTGARRRLRRPVLIGGLIGLLAAAVTYLLAQALVAVLGDGGLRLQAITGLLAIAVLLVVTNWFFHKVYWSEWIGRFNRRRTMLEQVDRLGFISGQTAGLLLLGVTSVYREGFETVLFLQNLQISAGTGATLLGVGCGLAATAVVGVATFALERKLPYKRMLIATGVLIGLVLGIMVGTTVHNLQGLGWIPATPTGFSISLTFGRWLGLYANWQGIVAQLAALLVVYGSYALARTMQRHRRRRAVSRTGTAAPTQS